MLKIIADENIIFAGEAFSPLGEVTLVPGREINNSILIDADVLLVRSVTNVNKELLDNTKVKFVGTATIGRDHIDQEYLDSRGIFFTDAAGCNADAVAEYVFTALFDIAIENQMILGEKSIGIVGVGNIGSRISKLASALGMKVLKNDPPLERLTGRQDYLPLDDLMNCDIITLHVPLNMEGTDRTFHLFDDQRLEKLKDGCILINASRGPVINNSALNNVIDKKDLTVVLDVWENEPEISIPLLEKIKIATPHVAGYSYEGKINGTVMLYNALCNYMNKKPLWKPVLPEVRGKMIRLDITDETKDMYELFSGIYNIRTDDGQLRKIREKEKGETGNYFDSLRKQYPLRREFSNYFVNMNPGNSKIESFLKTFRFNLTG